MIELDNEARTLLALARDAHDPGDGDRARVRAALASRIGVAAGLGLAAGLGVVAKTTATTATAGAGAGMTAGAVGAGVGALKLIGAALVVSATLGAGAAVVHHARRASVARVVGSEEASSPNRRPRTSAAAAGVSPAAPETAPPEGPAPANGPTPQPAKVDPSDGRPIVSSAAKKLPPTHALASTSNEGLGNAGGVPARPVAREAAPAARERAPAVADEASLFHDGIVALRSGQPARALVLFDVHARLYPHGVLAEEREAERALALADLGRTPEARAAIDRFMQAHPTSPLAARLLARARLLDPAAAKPGPADEPGRPVTQRPAP